jgi:exopolysaccharide production protein ExoQ
VTAFSSPYEDEKQKDNDRSALGFLHYAACVIALLGFYGPLRMAGIVDEEGALERILTMSFYVVVFLITTYTVIRNWADSKKIIKQNRWFSIYLGFAVLSALWSTMVVVSINRAIQLCCISGMAISIALFYKNGDLCRLLRVSTAIVIGFVILYSITDPVDSGLADLQNRFRGPFETPNGLGQICAVAVCVWFPILLFRRSHIQFVVALGVIATSVVAVVWADSITSMAMILFVMGAGIISRWAVPISPDVRSLMKTAGFLLLILCCMVAISRGGEIVDYIVSRSFESLGRTSDLTGRLPFWTVLFSDLVSSHRLLFGYGIGGFWYKDSGPAYDLLYGGWTPNQAHNGFLDIVIHTGIVGLLLFLPYLVSSLKDARRYLRHGGMEGLTLFNIIMALTILNFTESHFVRMISYLWILFNTASVYIRDRLSKLNVV